MDQSSDVKLRARSTSRTLPIALLRARETVMSPIREILQEINLTEQKWRILRTLDELGEVEQSTISKEACLLLPSLTRTLRAMEAEKLIARRQDADDKRRTLVEISDKGRLLLANNISQATEVYAAIEDQLGRQKVTQLLDLLEELRHVKI
ncbi:homoprotocatechuate degradation operon regulator HpaR [Maritalea sp.]|uniref:homoprotocatechuate degradation operon regulator HpaR n=1 Tax=Maritalea sp. TaxID=2003361 RepID=UPI003EF0DC37